MAASAQSSVTLYGRADGGVEYLNHIANGTGGNASRWSAEGGDWGTSMLGFKGTEDLGGGNSALFDLETALQLMNGTTGGGKMFSRRAYVGLKNETWGQLQAGAISSSTAMACGNSIRSCSRRSRRPRSCAGATGSKRATMSNITAPSGTASTRRGSTPSATRRAASTTAPKAISAARTASC